MMQEDQHCSLLFVDDDPKAGELLQRFCQGTNYRCESFRDPVEALGHFGRSGADVVVTDLRMPGMDGLELLARIRDLDSEVPVIIVTAYSRLEHAIEALRQGASDFLKKPFDMEELMLVVDKTLSQSMVMGLLLHAMPQAQIIWMRRRPEDIALSAYRAFFTSSVSWSWSMEDIAHQMKLEDQLFAHWTALFPDRILTVQYEDMVRDPQSWIPRLLGHAGLEMEEGVLEFHKNRRKVRTASVKQVRSAISTDAIGKSEKFAAQLEPFRTAYYG